MTTQKFSDQFKNLNFKEIGAWPKAPKTVALSVLFAAIVGAAFHFDTKDQLNELDQAAAQEASLKQDYVSKYARAVNLDLYKKQLADVNEAFGSLLKQLPDKSKMEALITDINQSGISQGLQFELFRPATQETQQEFYAELPIALKVTGDFHKMGNFSSEVGRLSRIVTLNDLSVSITATGLMQMEATAKTFRYLNDQEIAARQAAAAAQKKAKRER